MAIKAPMPDAPPVTIADLFLRLEVFKAFNRSAIGVMVDYAEYTSMYREYRREME